MCTLVVLRRPGHRWPLILGANRDEMGDRPWSPPGRHWPDRPRILAGRDDLAGGTWLGLNDDGVVVGVLNRRGSLGPAEGLRSRGELPLLALEHADAIRAAAAMAKTDPADYRSFNLVIADSRNAFWLCARRGGDTPPASPAVELKALPPGVSMITASDCNDPASDRIRSNLPRFKSAPAPEPDEGDWSAWEALMASRRHEAGTGPDAAMLVATDTGFGTVSSALMALPSPTRRKATPIWRFAARRPDEAPFLPVTL